jgi:hypothetical protein
MRGCNSVGQENMFNKIYKRLIGIYFLFNIQTIIQ